MKSEDIESYARRCGDYLRSLKRDYTHVYFKADRFFLKPELGYYVDCPNGYSISRKIIRDALLENKKIEIDTLYIFGGGETALEVEDSVRKYLKKFLDE